MRKIAKNIISAIQSGKPFTGGNTVVGGGRVYLHGNLIAKQCPILNTWQFTFAGYLTNTTRDRINAVRVAAGLRTVSLTQFKQPGDSVVWFS